MFRIFPLIQVADDANLKISGAWIEDVGTMSELELANLNYYFDGKTLS